MDKNTGFVKIYRSITKWGWYQDANTARVFFHCILMANFEDREWRGIKIPRGTFVTSLKNLSKELRISVDKVRTALEHLKMTHEITSKGTSRCTIITLNKYNAYQQNPTQNPEQIPCTSHANPKQFPNKSQQLNKERIKERKKGRREEYYDLDKIFENLMEEARKEGKL